jgi:hypothetical protein
MNSRMIAGFRPHALQIALAAIREYHNGQDCLIEKVHFKNKLVEAEQEFPDEPDEPGAFKREPDIMTITVKGRLSAGEQFSCFCTFRSGDYHEQFGEDQLEWWCSTVVLLLRGRTFYSDVAFVERNRSGEIIQPCTRYIALYGSNSLGRPSAMSEEAFLLNLEKRGEYTCPIYQTDTREL